MCSPLKGFLLIVSFKATIDKWRIRFCFRGVQFISAVCCTPLISHRDHLRGMLDTAGIVSVVCGTPLRLSPRYVAHSRDDLCGMMNTKEIISAVWCTQRRWSLPYDAQTEEIALWSNIWAKSKPNSKIL